MKNVSVYFFSVLRNVCLDADVSGSSVQFISVSHVDFRFQEQLEQGVPAMCPRRSEMKHALAMFILQEVIGVSKKS